MCLFIDPPPGAVLRRPEAARPLRRPEAARPFRLPLPRSDRRWSWVVHRGRGRGVRANHSTSKPESQPDPAPGTSGALGCDGSSFALTSAAMNASGPATIRVRERTRVNNTPSALQAPPEPSPVSPLGRRDRGWTSGFTAWVTEWFPHGCPPSPQPSPSEGEGERAALSASHLRSGLAPLDTAWIRDSYWHP